MFKYKKFSKYDKFYTFTKPLNQANSKTQFLAFYGVCAKDLQNFFIKLVQSAFFCQRNLNKSRPESRSKYKFSLVK